jgi:hypothetical protein
MRGLAAIRISSNAVFGQLATEARDGDKPGECGPLYVRLTNLRQRNSFLKSERARTEQDQQSLPARRSC